MTILPDFRYIRPTGIDEAVATLAAGGAKPVAGATDLLPNLRRGLGEPDVLVDLGGIRALAEVEESNRGLVVGAGVSLTALAAHSTVGRDYPVIAEAAEAVAGPSHRMVATVGGNICQDTRCVFYNQSDWWRSGNGYCLKYKGDRCHVAPKSPRCFATYRGDLAPALMVLGAEAELVGPAGRRRLPLSQLFKDDGARHLTLETAEVLTAVTIPAEARRLTAGYTKIRIRDSIDFPLVGVAVALRRDNGRLAELRVALTATNSAPTVVDTSPLVDRPWDEAAVSLLSGRMNKTAKFQNTTTVGLKYRRRVLLSAVRRLVDSLWEKAA